MIVKNSDGRQFFVRVVFKGDRYGREDLLPSGEARPCLVHDKDDPMVEFYDRTYADKPGFGPRGQVCSRYSCKQLVDVTGGLALDLGVPEWALDGEAVRPVVEMARALLQGVTSGYAR